MKKLALWLDHAVLVEHEHTLRQVAAVLGIHLSTAFDWRHRLLDELDARDCGTLRGPIQLTELWFAHSEKGSRDLHRPSRAEVAGRRHSRRARVTVLVACDEKRDVVTELLPIPRGNVEILRDVLAWRIEGAPEFLGTSGPLSPAGILARTLKGTFRWVRGFEKHALLADAIGYGVALKGWLRKFRGVATRYLSNYLVWHRIKKDPPLRTALLSWPLTGDLFGPGPDELAQAA